MKELLAVFALTVSAGGPAHANDAPELATKTAEQAQARQFGIFFGGTASQYDLCVKKGFLPKGDQSAEEIAKSFLEKTLDDEPGRGPIGVCAGRLEYDEEGDFRKRVVLHAGKTCASVRASSGRSCWRRMRKK